MMLNFKFSLPVLAGLLAINTTYGMNSDHSGSAPRTSPRAPLTSAEKQQMLKLRQDGMRALDQKYGPSAGGSSRGPINSAAQKTALGRDRPQGPFGGRTQFNAKTWTNNQIINNGLGGGPNASQTRGTTSSKLDARGAAFGQPGFSSRPNIVTQGQSSQQRTTGPRGNITSNPQSQSPATIEGLKKAMPWLSEEQIRQKLNFGGGSPQQSPAAPSSNARPVFNSYSEEVAWKARQAGQVGQKK